MTSPLADTNDPLPPELKRTLDFWRCSSHCGVGSNWYFSLNCLRGGLLKSHIPSSAMTETAGRKSNRKAKRQKVRIGAETTAKGLSFQDGFFQILLLILILLLITGVRVNKIRSRRGGTWAAARARKRYRPKGWRASKPNGMRGAACQRGAQIRERLCNEVVSSRSPAITAKACPFRA